MGSKEEEEETSHTMLKMEKNLIRERRGTSAVMLVLMEEQHLQHI